MDTAKPMWTRIVAFVLLLWGVMGLWSFFSQVSMTAETMAGLPAGEQQIWSAMPGWLWVVYGVAVAAGFAGAVALLMGRALAVPLCLASLISVVVQFGYVFTATPILAIIGPSSIVFPAIIIVVAAVAAWLARSWAGKGWLR
jgi:hypothetical protein